MDQSHNSTPIGSKIRYLRKERGWKLGAVSRRVPVATLSAIERGRIVPSLATLDAITDGLDLPIGALDLLLLQSARSPEQRLVVLERLWENESVLTIQQTLRQLLHNAHGARERWNAEWLLVRHLERRRLWRRLIILLVPLVRNSAMPVSRRGESLSLLGKAYLIAGRPHDATGPLLHAVEDKTHRDAWESALCNLGLVWWKIGHYDEAAESWQRAVQTVVDPMRQAMAWIGLGNVAARRQNWLAAQDDYQTALQIYRTHGAGSTERMRVLNNILWCCVQRDAWDAAEVVVSEADGMKDSDPIVYGEFLATQAEA